MLNTLSGSTSFCVDADGLQILSSLQQAFESQTDTSQLVPGQIVQVRKRDLTGGPAPAVITLATDRVRLRATPTHGNSVRRPVGFQLQYR